MRCLKCKKEISDNLIRCNYCNTKVQSVCPVCGAKNPINKDFCSGCGLQLLKYCTSCNAVNLTNAEKCRKCGNVFEKDEFVSISDLMPEANNIPVQAPVENKQIASEVITEPNDDAPLKLYKTCEFEFRAYNPDDLTETNISNEEIKQEENVLTVNKIVEIEKTSDEQDFVKVDEDEVVEVVVKNQENVEDNKVVEQDIKNDIETENVIPNEIVVDGFDNKAINEISDEDNLSSFTEQVDLDLTSVAQDVDEVFCETDNQIKICDQMKCKNYIVNAIKRPDKLIIGMSAPEGYGKSTVLKYLFGDLMNQNCAWLWGECSANSQITPFGVFQEMVLTFFNMPNFSNMSQEFLRQAKTMISETFPIFTQEEVFELFNFLYPSLSSNFEDILINKDKTYHLLEKLILEISKKAKLIIVIDDFDMIDGASYEFLSYFVEQGNLSENIKLVLTYKDNRITQGYFYSEKLSQNQYEDIRLAQLTQKDSDNLISLFLNGSNPLPQELCQQIFEYSSGNSAYVEQLLIYLNENNVFEYKNNVVEYNQSQNIAELPKDIYEVLKIRLDKLEVDYLQAYKTLCTAAIMGNKFNVKLLGIIMKLSPDEFQNIIQTLSACAFIAQFNSNVYEFKNTLMWKFVYERAKQGSDFCVLNEKIYDIINSFTLSSNALKALIAQSLNQKLLALNIWTENIKLCAYLGDEHLWTLSQKQCLKIAQEINPENNNVIINNIQERLGKLLYISKPTEAIEYLGTAINNAIKVGNGPKVIELSGYLSKSCSLTGNYNGVIEAIDTILKYMDKENRLHLALIKHKKLKAMLAIGNAEEIHNMAANEIIPIVEQVLSGVSSSDDISLDLVFETWLECNLTVAMALISQGNKKAFEILSVINEIVEKNKVQNKNYIYRVVLAKAMAYSMQGEIKKSEDVLIEFSQKTANEVVDSEIISLWNFINILNKLFKRDFKNIKQDMYSVVTFANNYNDVLIKNLLKVFLGKILQEEDNLARALDIFNEQVTIFAREKIAIGAMLCWYFIAKITLVTEGTDKALDICQKALDVAKNPKVSNYYFMALYKRLIAEIFIIKGDMESAKMYIEKALLIAKQYDMKLLKVTLFQLYAKYLEEMVSKKTQNRVNYAQNAVNTYKKVLTLATDLGIPEIVNDIQKNYASFKAFCQLNSIPV